MTIPTPPRWVIENQMTVLREYEEFARSQRRWDVLKMIVESALDGTRINEDEIGFKIFAPKYQPDISNDVRVTCNNIRNILRAYYKDAGKSDVVIIDLPVGRSYKPTFLFNPGNHIYAQCENLKIRLRKYYPSDYESLHAEALKISDEAPSSPYAQNCLAQINLCYAVSNLCGERPREMLEEAHEAVLRALSLSPDFWEAHVIGGAVQACRQNWEDADRLFRDALRINGAATKSNLWYAAYQMTRNNAGEGTWIAMQQARLNPHDPWINDIAALFLYAAGCTGASAVMLNLDNARSTWIGCIVAALLNIEDKEFTSAGVHLGTAYDRLSAFVRDSRGGAPGVLVCAGLTSYLLAKTNVPYQPTKWRRMLHENQPFQLALSELAEADIGVIDEVMGHLYYALFAQEPLLTWAHIWPIFKSLRKRREFIDFLSTVGLKEADPLTDPITSPSESAS